MTKIYWKVISIPMTPLQNSEIEFFANKVYVHHWPQTSPSWDKFFQEKIDNDLNKKQEKKKIKINERKIKINDYEFLKIRKVGITIPLFKKETTLVFEASFGDLCGHIHITTTASNFLEIFNKLMDWKSIFFED